MNHTVGDYAHPTLWTGPRREYILFKSGGCQRVALPRYRTSSVMSLGPTGKAVVPSFRRQQPIHCLRSCIIALVGCIVAASCCDGCGLAIWPYAARYPDPVKRIRVEDRATGKAIQKAKVSYRVLPS